MIMNFIFISPQFPSTYYNWCDRLKKAGVNVLGIGDDAYESLNDNVKNALTEYYKVDSLGNYDSVFKAVAFFTFKYGKIDWLESNNEHWLEQDAKLREEFNITTGAHPEDMEAYKSKSAMKPFYAKAGVGSARCHKVIGMEDCKAFLEEVGYPVIVKPDNGVGASHTYKLSNDEDLQHFFDTKIDAPYVMEEFVVGDIFSYDAVTNDQCEVIFECNNVWPPSIADIVNNKTELTYYCSPKIDPKLQKAGRATVKAFNVKSRFVHLEFFRLRDAKKGLGEAGDFVGLECNMRPAGGFTPDMMNYALSTDVYQIWADMVTTNTRKKEIGGQNCCAYASRRNHVEYAHSHEDILNKYGSRIKMHEPVPEVLSGAMGNYMYLCFGEDDEAVKEFIAYVIERK